jgi:hypothetical protein
MTVIYNQLIQGKINYKNKSEITRVIAGKTPQSEWERRARANE